MEIGKNILKKQKIYKRILPTILYVILIISIFSAIIYVYTRQYNLKGISNILSVYIDPEREKIWTSCKRSFNKDYIL